MSSAMLQQLIATLKQEIKEELTAQFQDEIQSLKRRIEDLENEQNEEIKLSFEQLRIKNRMNKKPASQSSSQEEILVTDESEEDEETLSDTEYESCSSDN